MAKQRDNTSKCSRSGQDHLRYGQEAYVAASKVLSDPDVIPEDRPLDPVLLGKALEHYHQATVEFAASGQASLEASALLGQAEVLLRMPVNTPEAHERILQAEHCSRTALERLDCTQEPFLVLRGFLLLGEAMFHTIQTRPEQREARLRSLSAILESAACLAQDQENATFLAEIRRQFSHVLSERYERDRDENLLDAIDQGERALESLRQVPTARTFELPKLLNHLGNCCVKVGGDRLHWLARGRDLYQEGAAAVDVRRYPRLHRMLNESAIIVETSLKNGAYSLPEKEIVERYGSGIHMALNDHDHSKARSLAGGFLAWAWSLPSTPNVHIGQAHKVRARVAMSLDDWGEAQQHLYHSVGILSAVLPEKNPWYYLLSEARDLLVKVLQRNGLTESLELWLNRAAQSFNQADSACRRGVQMIEQNSTTAMFEFEYALNVFTYHPMARFYRGVVRMTDNDLAGALSDFDLYIMLKTKDLRAHLYRASVKLKMGNKDGALADVHAAVEIDSANVEALYMRAQLYQQRGQREKAMTDLESALKHSIDLQHQTLIEERLNALREKPNESDSSRAMESGLRNDSPHKHL